MSTPWSALRGPAAPQRLVLSTQRSISSIPGLHSVLNSYINRLPFSLPDFPSPLSFSSPSFPSSLPLFHPFLASLLFSFLPFLSSLSFLPFPSLPFLKHQSSLPITSPSSLSLNMNCLFLSLYPPSLPLFPSPPFHKCLKQQDFLTTPELLSQYTPQNPLLPQDLEDLSGLSPLQTGHWQSPPICKHFTNHASNLQNTQAFVLMVVDCVNGWVFLECPSVGVSI